jgi:acyl-CoA thioester hydrolase
MSSGIFFNFAAMKIFDEVYRNIIRFPVRFADLDAMGHVNNVTFLRYFEEGRVSWFRECMGLPLESTAYPVIVARVEMDYLAPIPFGVEVAVATRCSRIGGKSMTIEGEIRIVAAEQVPVSRYTCTVVYYDYKSRLTVNVPEADRKRIADFEPGLS